MLRRGHCEILCLVLCAGGMTGNAHIANCLPQPGLCMYTEQTQNIVHDNIC